MADFSFISRCGKCSDNPLDNDNVKVNCDESGTCCIDISVGTRQISCTNATGIADCLSNPEFSYENGIQDPTPIPNLGQPDTFTGLMSVYKTIRKIISPCADLTDEECVPYGGTYFTQDKSQVNDGRCRDDEPNNYALLTDPEKTQHPVYQMDYCEWLTSPTLGDPQVPGGGCTIFTGDSSDDPSGTNTCGKSSFLVPQCGNVCCPSSDFKNLDTADSCVTGDNYFFEVKNCTGYNTCKSSCGPDGICSCATDNDCKTGDLCNTTYNRCYTPDSSEVDNCVVRPKALSGVCTGYCSEDEIAEGKGTYPNCCTFQVTHEKGTTCNIANGTCCDAGMECKDIDSNELLMPSNQNTWNENEGNTDFRTGVGVCICENNDQCKTAGASQTELYSCENDPHSDISRNVCVSGTIDRCLPDDNYTKGLTSGPPNIFEVDLPGFDGKGCKQGVSCSSMYGSSTYGHCECNTDNDCESGYSCSDVDGGIKKCLKIESISGIKPTSLKNTNGTLGGDGPNTEYEETYATGGYLFDAWNNKRCNYCNNLINQGCSWSKDDQGCSKIYGKPTRINDCTVEVDAPAGQLIWEGWGNDWSLCCPSSGISTDLNLETIEFIDINKNQCSSWADFSNSPNKQGQKTEFCGIYCPDKETQDALVEVGQISPNQVCDANYVNLCEQVGCTVDTVNCEIVWQETGGPGSLPKITAPLDNTIVTFDQNNKTVAACNETFANVDYVNGRSYSNLLEGYSLF